jgi:hypothetical protein
MSHAYTLALLNGQPASTSIYASTDAHTGISARLEFSHQEDVKKLISLSFRDFIFDPKCLPTSQRSLIRHPGAIFLTPS